MVQYNKAFPLYEQCLEKRRQMLGDDHPETLSSISNLANCYWNMGKYNKALPLLELCLERRKQVLGCSHQDTQTSESNLILFRQEASNRKGCVIN